MSAWAGAEKYPNSGEPELRDLKGQLWRCETVCWIDTGIRGCAFRLHGVPDGLMVAEHTDNGRLWIRPGYVFDGSSIPLLGRWIDDRVSAWPGAVHDVAYEAIRAGKISRDERGIWDDLYRDMLHAFGAWWVTSRLCRVGLWLFGYRSTQRSPEYVIRGA